MTINRNRWIGIILALVILLTAGIRIRLLSVPFERDEGEYAYVGQLILQGIPPYQQAYNMKMPGIYVAYALLLAVFGQSQVGVHFGLLLLNAATVILFFFLARKLMRPWTALAAAAVLALLTVGEPVRGFTANAEHFILLPALGGLLLFLHARRPDGRLSLGRLFLAGMLLGLGAIVKQHGGAYILFTGIVLFVDLLRKKTPLLQLPAPLFLFSIGAALPFGVTCLTLYALGVFDTFWFWTFTYAREYVAMMPLKYGLHRLWDTGSWILSESTALWVLATVGLITAWWKSHPHKWFLTGFWLCSFLAVCPGLYFRDHYFILLLPATALLAAAGLEWICTLIQSWLSHPARTIFTVLLPALLLAFTLYQQYDYFFVKPPRQVIRDSYSFRNPYAQSLEVAQYLRENSSPDDYVFVAGSEPQIYFYAQRRSASGFLYVYPLMEEHPFAGWMQEQMIRQVQHAQPKLIVYIHSYNSWAMLKNSPRIFPDWLDMYLAREYTRVGFLEFFRHDQDRIVWGEKALRCKPLDEFYITIHRRNIAPAAPPPVLPLEKPPSVRSQR